MYIKQEWLLKHKLFCSRIPLLKNVQLHVNSEQTGNITLPRGFMILSLQYPNLKYSQKGFHQDHMHPYSGFEEEKMDGLVLPDGSVIDDATKEEWRRRRNTLANLQLLEGRENESTNDTPLVDWLKAEENSENAKYLPEGISYELSNFEEFMEKRQELMSGALKKILLC